MILVGNSWALFLIGKELFRWGVVLEPTVRVRTDLWRLGQLGPVVLIEAAHDAGNDDAVGEVPLELGDNLAPVGGRLLADELDVEEGALVGAVVVARGRPAHDAGRDVGDDVLREEECDRC